MLDALPYSPATLKTATWDVVAWNRAAAVHAGRLRRVPPGRRNVLRMLFLDPAARAVHPGGRTRPRAVAAFRIDAARAGAGAEVAPLVEELCAGSPAFAAMWRAHDVQPSAGVVKRLRHPVLGPITLEYASLAVDAQRDLAVAVWNPVTARDRRAVQSLLATEDPRPEDAEAGSSQA